jgi:hypothetical protein
MIKNVKDNCRIYGLIIDKTTKKSLVLNYGLSNATFETLNHAFNPLSSLAYLIVITLGFPFMNTKKPQFLVGSKNVIIEFKTYHEQPLPRMIILV